MRAPTLPDAPALAELGRSTFVDTFGHLYSAENLNLFLEQVYHIDAVADDIANPRRIIRVVEHDGAMIAYCKLGLEAKLDYDWGDRKVMELMQLYVRSDQHGSGVAGKLMDWALSEARAHNMDVVALSVWSENYRAQRFYERHGFIKIASTYFMVGNHRDDELIYGLNLT